MKKKLFSTIVTVALLSVFAVIPVMAGTLEEDKAWVEAQAAAGLASAQAALDAAQAAIAPAAADRDAQAKAGLESGLAYLRAAGWNV